jgi:hypothetical protein
MWNQLVFSELYFYLKGRIHSSILVSNTISISPWCSSRLTVKTRVPIFVEHKLLTIPEHLSSPLIFSRLSKNICYSLPFCAEHANKYKTNRQYNIKEKDKQWSTRRCADTDKIYRLNNTKPTKNQGWTQMFRKGKQFVLHKCE